MLIRTGDTVEVIAGNDSGQKSRVIKVDRATGKAIVEGVNRVQEAHSPQPEVSAGRRAEQGNAGSAIELEILLPVVQQSGPFGRPVPRRRQQGTIL